MGSRVFTVRRLLALLAFAVIAALTPTLGEPARAQDAPAPQVSGVSPASWFMGEPREVVITGSGFREGATFKLVREGRTLDGRTPRVDSPTEMRTVIWGSDTFYTTSAGAYDAVVTNPDGQQATWSGKVEIKTMPQIFPFVDCIKRDPATGAPTHAYFGYVNTGDVRTRSYGRSNYVSPDGEYRAYEATYFQPYFFLPGVHRGVQIPLEANGTRLTWSLSGYPATADVQSGPFCDAPRPEADLRVSQSVSAPAVAGSDLTYTLTATNAGPDEATGVLLTDALPGDVDLVSVTPPEGTTCSEGETVACRVGSLATGASASVEVKVRPKRAATLVNTATVFSTATHDVAPENNSSVERTLAVAPPSAVTGAARDLSRTGATVRALVDPGGVETEYRFEYGTGGSYGRSTPAQTLGADPGQTGVQATLEGLAPGTRYGYRIVAVNAHGTSVGEGETFTTSPLATTRLSLITGATSVKPGRAVDLAGRFTAPGEPVANRRVALYAKVSGSDVFRQVRSARTDASGDYAFRDLKPGKTTFYQVRFAGNPDEGLAASNSPVRRVIVRR